MIYKKDNKQEFCVGEIVKVVDVPYMDCKFSWVRSMNRYCGRDVVIENAEWDKFNRCYRYIIDADNGVHAWCNGCFEQVLPDIEESALDICALFQ